MDASLALPLASVFAASVAALSAYASSRAAASSTTKNTTTTVEAKRLEQAYERARKFDIETIQRQDTEIETLRDSEAELSAQVVALRLRVTNLEVEVHKYKQEIANIKKNKRSPNTKSSTEVEKTEGEQ